MRECLLSTLTHTPFESALLGRLLRPVGLGPSSAPPAMASVEGIPACLFAEPKVTQPPHLEGDPALATEILPGPPPLSSIQAGGLAKKDHKKAPVAVSYLPQTDPGTTYVGPNAVGTVATVPEVDGPRRKRARLDKGCVSYPSYAAQALT